MEKDINAMTRTEVIQELAQYAHPSYYHKLLDWSTQHLRVLLTYYKFEGIVITGGRQAGRVTVKKALEEMATL